MAKCLSADGFCVGGHPSPKKVSPESLRRRPHATQVLHCISQLERLQLIGTRGARRDAVQEKPEAHGVQAGLPVLPDGGGCAELSLGNLSTEASLCLPCFALAFLIWMARVAESLSPASASRR